MSKKLTLKPEQFETELYPFYRNVATELGHTETENTMYDCREINVANNIQEAWFKYYEEKYNVTKTDVAMLLLMSGAKVDTDLKDNEVEVFDGFITEIGA